MKFESLGTSFTCVTTDSRKVKPGCLFVAVKGDTHDGHAFIGAAEAAGARGVLCRKGTSHSFKSETQVFFVDDTTESFRKLAHEWRLKFSIPLIAVAGSTGKTTTKEFLAALLRGRYKNVLKTEKSQNGFLGVAMTLLELRPEHDIAVVEIGIDAPGAMEQHLEVVEPTASLLTAIGPEHLEKLVDIQTVAREESFAVSWVAKKGGIVVINKDDPWVSPLLNKEKSGKYFSFSIQGRYNEANSTVRVAGVDLLVPLSGRHNAENLLCAATMAEALGLSGDEMKKGLASFTPVEGRSEFKQTTAGVHVLCDYYNANPTSMSAAFDLFESKTLEIKPATRWLCLADMKELGSLEEKFHRELSTKVFKMNPEHVLLYGDRMKWLCDELKTKKFKNELVHFSKIEDLGRKLKNELRAGDLVLIKGSRSMQMEKVWKMLEG